MIKPRRQPLTVAFLVFGRYRFHFIATVRLYPAIPRLDKWTNISRCCMSDLLAKLRDLRFNP
jgi:hypothetical protein